MIRDVLAWLLFGHVVLSPVGLLGVGYWAVVVKEWVHLWWRRRRTGFIDVPSGGYYSVTGADDAQLARIVELTGGRLRPRPGRGKRSSGGDA